MTDILIPLGAGSRYKNRELRYCLRSIEKHLTGVRNVWIVGDRPEWLRNVVHVPCQDNPSNWMRANNIYRKIMKGVETMAYYRPEDAMTGMPVTLSDTFLFMNDDHYLLADYEAAKFPYYHRGTVDLFACTGNQPQYIQMNNTVELLKRLADNIFDFDVHCPIVYEKQSFKVIFGQTQWPPFGYGIKTVYGNCQIPALLNGVPCEDLKFKEPAMKESIYRAMEGRKWFSIGDRCLKSPGQMFEVLEELYPVPSKYEA